MARMYPEELSNVRRDEISSRAEVLLYDALAATLDDAWVVFHSVAWQDHATREGGSRDGETDFIIAHPDLGVLTVEVKGGLIGYDGDSQTWTSTDSRGVSYSIRPFEQARRVKYSLLNYVAQEDKDRVKKLRPAIHDAVIFPQCSAPSSGLPPEAPRAMIIDGVDMGDLEGSLKRVFEHHRGKNAKRLQGGPALIEELLRRLAPSLVMANPLAVSLVTEQREYVRLTERQAELLHHLRRSRRLAVSGCAGSGKTMLAVEKAKQLAADGFRTLVTCFNKGLSGYLVERTAGIDGLVVANYHKLCAEFASKAEVGWAPGDSSWEMAPDALIEAVERKPELRFDAVIVDEAQDFKDTWWVSILSLLSSEEDGILYVFFDDNQRVYGGERVLPSGLELSPLDENVRNTRAIFRCVDPFYQGEDPVRPRGPSGRTVEQVVYAGPEQLQRCVSRVIHRLVADEQIRPDQIVVLTPNSREHSLLKGVGKLGTVSATWDDDGPGRAVRVSTIHSFKGLERPVVVVCELDAAFVAREDFVQLAYVAFSRPQHHLVVLGTGDALAQLLPSQQSGVAQ